MTDDQINAALARWLGWHLSGSCWVDQDDRWVSHTTNNPQDPAYFNPMQRIDHAWLLVEHIKTTDWYINFLDWTNSKSSDLFMMPAPEAARAICEAIIEIAGIEV